MSSIAKTVFAFGLYLLGLGAILLIVPNLLLGLFQIPSTSEVWIRVVGMLVFYLGIYYLVAAKTGLRVFMLWSARLRPTVLLFFGAFVLAGLAPSVLLIFGAIDLAGAIWTWNAFRQEAINRSPHAA